MLSWANLLRLDMALTMMATLSIVGCCCDFCDQQEQTLCHLIYGCRLAKMGQVYKIGFQQSEELTALFV